MLKHLYRFPYPHLAVFMVFIYLYYFSKSQASYYLLPIALFYFPNTQASESVQRFITLALKPLAVVFALLLGFFLPIILFLFAFIFI
jgi:hypothetical protein